MLCMRPNALEPILSINRSTLRTGSRRIHETVQELLQFLKSTSFTRALVVGLAVTIPIVAGLLLGVLDIGLALGFGAFWSSPSDISGSFKHKKYGILISAALAMVVAFIGGHLHYETWLSLPILGVLSFSIAYLSVYGFRATLISFSGLLALILSFALDPGDLEIHQYALLIGVGGLWYLLLAKIWYRVNAKAEIEEFLSQTYALTADLLETRGKLVGQQVDREKLQSKLLNLQSALTENHETLRELLILSRKPSGWTNYQNKRLLIFVQLIDMLETAIANSGDHDRMDALLRSHPRSIKAFQGLFFEMSRHLRRISEAASGKRMLPNNDELQQYLEIDQVKRSLRAEDLAHDEYFLLRNLIEYQEKQFDKLKKIKLLLGEADTLKVEPIDHKYAQRFITTQNLDPRLLVRNFGLRSSIFRHSMRLSVTVMVGYALGLLFPFQNPYWILLTIIVIMRPSYGLTKRRAKDRMLGTLIGGSIATAAVFLIGDPNVYAALSIASLVISVSMLQKNFRAASIFITLAVVFLYAIIEPDILTGIKFRIIDTPKRCARLCASAGSAYLGVRGDQRKCRKKREGNNTSSGRSPSSMRKGPAHRIQHRAQGAFCNLNLNLAFQRMAEGETAEYRYRVRAGHPEPHVPGLAGITEHLHTALHHTEASEQFRSTTDKSTRAWIERSQREAEQLDLTNRPSPNESPFEQPQLVFKHLELSDLASKDQGTIRDLQEAHLVWEQMQWLYSISGKMLKLAASVKGGR